MIQVEDPRKVRKRQHKKVKRQPKMVKTAKDEAKEAKAAACKFHIPEESYERKRARENDIKRGKFAYDIKVAHNVMVEKNPKEDATLMQQLRVQTELFANNILEGMIPRDDYFRIERALRFNMTTKGKQQLLKNMKILNRKRAAEWKAKEKERLRVEALHKTNEVSEKMAESS